MLRLGQERDELSVVSDQIGSPTYADDLAGVILGITQNKSIREAVQTTQIYHYSNEGEINWHEFSKEIFKIAKIDCKTSPILTEQYPTPTQRPKNTSMNKSKIMKTFNVNLAPWKDSLEKFLTN